MVEVGSLEIVGSINVEGIRAGLRDMRRGLDQAKDSAKSAFADMERLGSGIANIAKPLALLGGGISGVFLGLASMAPQAAASLGRIQADFFRLSTIVGDVFAPIIEKAADVFQGFVDWLGSPEGIGVLNAVRDVIAGLGAGILDLVSSFANLARKWTVGLDLDIGDDLKWFVETFGPETLAAVMGWKFAGPAGAAAAAGTTAFVRGAGAEQQTPLSATKTAGGLGLLGAGLGSIIPGIGTILGGITGLGVGAGLELEKFLNNFAGLKEGTISVTAPGTNLVKLLSLFEGEVDVRSFYKEANT